MNGQGHAHSHAQDRVTTQGRTIHWAHQYNFFVKLLMFGREKKFREEIIRQAAIPAHATVLDVGCGTGTLALLAKAQVGEHSKVYGIDAAPEMIEVAQQKSHQQQCEVDFRHAAIEALPFEDEMFDVVLSSIMFHHLPDDLKRHGLAEVYRVLKPGGRLLIVDIQRPTNLVQRISMTLMLHGDMVVGIQDISPMMKEAGYTNLQIKNAQWNLLGFLQGQRESSI